MPIYVTGLMIQINNRFPPDAQFNAGHQNDFECPSEYGFFRMEFSTSNTWIRTEHRLGTVTPDPSVLLEFHHINYSRQGGAYYCLVPLPENRGIMLTTVLYHLYVNEWTLEENAQMLMSAIMAHPEMVQRMDDEWARRIGFVPGR